MRLHYGQIVLVEVAGAALVTAAVIGSATAWTLAGSVAAGLLVLCFGRLRHRSLRSWFATALRYFTHTHRLPTGGDADGLLGLLDPAAVLHDAELGGEPTGLIEDTGGLTAVLEFGGDGCELAGMLLLPPLDELLPPAEDRHGAPEGTGPQPRMNVQLLVAGGPAPAPRVAGVLANSYRQLSMGRVPARRRALLAVRACRDDPGWMYEDLRTSLSRAVRAIRRRLAQEQVPVRAVPAAPLRCVLAELAHHDPGQPVRERWARLRIGGLHQATLLVRHWSRPQAAAHPQPTAPAAGTGVPPDGAGAAPSGGQDQPLPHLLARLLCLPATAVTVGLTVGRDGGQLVVRLAAENAAALAAASTALRRMLGGLSMASAGLDGAQRDGLIATLPLARLRWPVRGARSPLVLPAAGLMLGRDRHGEPVTIHLGRPEPATAMLVGGVRAAALVAMRALALGTEVAVQTARPLAWEPYLRAVSMPGQVPVLPPDRPLAFPPATPLAPQLVIVDGGDGAPPVQAAPWRTILVVRDVLTPAGAATLARADLVILQPLSPAEAALAGGALGLGVSQEWLSAIRADMVGVVSRGQVRWARLSPSPVEVQVVGVPERAAPSGASV